jgi:hypothetical protein
VCLSTGVAVRIDREHFSVDVTTDTIVACLSHSSPAEHDSPAEVRVTCCFKSGRLMTVSLGVAHPVLAPVTHCLTHSIDIVVEWGERVAITSASNIFIYNRENLRASSSSTGTGPGARAAEQEYAHVPSCALLPQAPSVACALSGLGGMLAISCESKLVVIMQRDYRMMTANLGVCHAMVEAGPCLLVTVGKDGILRVVRVCVQQQHVLLHLLWAGDRYYDKPLFGSVHPSALPACVCVFLPDASILNITVCPACDAVSATPAIAAPKRDHVVVASATAVLRSNESVIQRSVVMFDDGCLHVRTQSNAGCSGTWQTHVVSLNSQLRLLGLFDRWILLCDGSTLRMFDCGQHHATPTASKAVASLLQECPGISIRARHPDPVHAPHPQTEPCAVDVAETLVQSPIRSPKADVECRADALGDHAGEPRPKSGSADIVSAADGIASPRPQVAEERAAAAGALSPRSDGEDVSAGERRVSHICP